MALFRLIFGRNEASGLNNIFICLPGLSLDFLNKLSGKRKIQITWASEGKSSLWVLGGQTYQQDCNTLNKRLLDYNITYYNITIQPATDTILLDADFKISRMFCHFPGCFAQNILSRQKI